MTRTRRHKDTGADATSANRSGGCEDQTKNTSQS